MSLTNSLATPFPTVIIRNTLACAKQNNSLRWEIADVTLSLGCIPVDGCPQQKQMRVHSSRCLGGLEGSDFPVPWLYTDPNIIFYYVFCLLLLLVLSIRLIKNSAFSSQTHTTILNCWPQQKESLNNDPLWLVPTWCMSETHKEAALYWPPPPCQCCGMDAPSLWELTW